jgi:tRNA (uracil-5-)-methyltransferase TRM9
MDKQQQQTTNHIYNSISEDFDSSRYSVWNAVKKFLDTLQPNSKLADIGCGNGKNMLYRKDLCCQGIDFSEHLVSICKSKNLNAIIGNILHIPFEVNYFDNTICIAVIHHLETQYERIEAIRELLRITKPGGKILMSVWAKDQEANSKRNFQSNNVYVPFHTKDGSVYQRFYHVYNKGELEYDLSFISDIKFMIENIFYEMGNWYIILEKSM